MLELLRHSLKFTMLQPFPVSPVPPDTMRVARAALRIQNSCLQLRDSLGTVFDNEMFAPLFPERGQPAAAPWRLALVTILQFSEGLSAGMLPMPYAHGSIGSIVGLELGDPGFDYSILSRFRDRLIEGRAGDVVAAKAP